VDVSGLGFGNPVELSAIAKARGFSEFEPSIETHTVLFSPAMMDVTLVATPYHADNPDHPPILDEQIITLVSTDNTFELQRLVIVSPENSGGGFRLQTEDGTATTEEMSFLATRQTMYEQIMSLDLVPEVTVERQRQPPDSNGTQVIIWDITFLDLRPVGLLVILRDNALFPDVQASMSVLRWGVAPLGGTFTLSMPDIHFGPTVPIPFDASYVTMTNALKSMPYPARYAPVTVSSVSYGVVSTPGVGFASVGFTTRTWHLKLVLNPFEGIDQQGRYHDLVPDVTNLHDGRDVTLTVRHVVTGQAGQRYVAGSIDVGVLGKEQSMNFVSIPSASYSSKYELLSLLVGGLQSVQVIKVDVTRHEGDELNDNGLSISSGYGVGHHGLLNGYGVGYTWRIQYVPQGMVQSCVQYGRFTETAPLTFDFSSLTGTDVSSTATVTHGFNCIAVENRLANHTNKALRVHLSSLTQYQEDYSAYYRSFENALRPVGHWRSPQLDMQGSTTGRVANQGTFGGTGMVIGAVDTDLGFSAADADAAFSLPGLSSALLQLPFK
jgi:hypothetical protein